MSSYVGQFDDDYNQLQKDSEAYQNAVNQLQAEQAAYEKEFASAFSSTNPELVFLALIYAFSNPGFSELDGGLSVNGAALQVQGDLTKLGNDLENMTHPSKNDPEYYSSTLVHDAATRLDEMLDALSPTNQTSWVQSMQNAIGSTAGTSLYGQYLVVRQTIYDGSDPEGGKYNPTQADPGTGSRTYYFDADPNDAYYGDYINSFGDMQDDMSQQGDPMQANEASKTMTDAFNTNTATTQSVQAATNEMITNDTNTIKTFQSFVSDMMHALSQVISAAVQNYTKA